MRTVKWGWNGHSYSRSASIPSEWTGGIEEYIKYVDTTGSALFPVIDDPIYHLAQYSPIGSDTWQCDYCGTSYWVKKEELQCKKCGAPRDV